MSEEIIGGLKNAMARGISLEDAIQSFINAGYNPVEVRQSAQALRMGVTSFNENIPQESPEERAHEDEERQQHLPIQQIPKQIRPQVPQQQMPQRYQQQIPQPAPQFQHQMPQQQMLQQQMNFGGARRLSEIRMLPPKRKQNYGLIIALIIFLLILIGGLIFMILEGQDLLDKLLQSA